MWVLLLLLVSVSASLIRPEDEILFSKGTLAILNEYGITNDQSTPKSREITEKSYMFMKNHPTCPPNNQIATFDHDTMTLHPLWTSKCSKARHCIHEYNLAPTHKRHKDNKLRRWVPFTDAVTLGAGQQYSATDLPNNIYVQVRCLCSGKLIRLSDIPNSVNADGLWQNNAVLPPTKPATLDAPALTDPLGGLRNVVVLMQDAVSRTRAANYMPDYWSRLHAMNTLPEAERNWTAFVMGSYHSSGYNTPANEMPLYAGMSHEHFDFSGTVGYFPHEGKEPAVRWIWNDLRDLGFAVGWGSEACLKMFNYLSGLPTMEQQFDYLRYGPHCALLHDHFHRTMTNERFCFGDEPHGLPYVQFIADVLRAEEGRRRVFFFADFEEGHNMALPATAHFLEESTQSAVDRFMDGRNDTLLIVMADHGMQYGSWYDTPYGKLDHRLPNLQVLAPQWWLDGHPDVKAALYQNQHEILTTYDLHATFRHLAEYPAPFSAVAPALSYMERPPGVARSLLEPLGGSTMRTCTDAGIPEDWCILQPGAVREMDAALIASEPAHDFLALALARVNELAAAGGDTCQNATLKTGLIKAGSIMSLDSGWDFWRFDFDVAQFESTFHAEGRLWRGDTELPADTDAGPTLTLVKQVSLYSRFDSCKSGSALPGFCLCDFGGVDSDEAEVTAKGRSVVATLAPFIAILFALLVVGTVVATIVWKKMANAASWARRLGGGVPLQA
ncbi:Protein of unknown function DUF229 [Carpediemonas membranifera]|uniref:Uncharacterized protein n=1 Tax=Carpediemonas membranifera TaxID=201153 RepID=A0A8J6E1A4_9EUKA|nr:Protein of unknown function DUF229 [Carpediemonas membranifera]|eukprot:KAG9396099.1 Protein of unknown function DUF229 [Carpediemonas membranifera]